MAISENPLRVNRDFEEPVKIGTVNPNIQLRQFVPEDSRKIFQLIDTNREHLSRNGDVTSEKYPTEQSVLESITDPSNPDKLRMGIWHENDYVGTANLIPFGSERTAEIGVYLGSQYTGQGFMTIAAQALTEYAFEREIQRVFAFIAAENAESIALFQRLGYIEGKRAVEGDRKRIYYYKTQQD